MAKKIIGDKMSLILTRKGKDTGEEVYSRINTEIDEKMSEELKAKKIALTDSEKEQIMKKCPIEKIENDVDKINFTLGLCYWEILDLIDMCGYLLSTNQNLINSHCLKEFKKNKKDKKAFSKVEMDCIHDLEKELEMTNDKLRFINELFEQVIEEIRENKEDNEEN